MNFSSKRGSVKGLFIVKSGCFKGFIFLNIIHFVFSGFEANGQEAHMSHKVEKEPKNLITLTLG